MVIKLSDDKMSLNEALIEASRCLNCKVPTCMQGCPAHVEIPKFISKIVDMKYSEAYQIITKNNVFPSITSRVCYKCNQCEGNCNLIKRDGVSVQIGKLERCIADYVSSKDLYKELNPIINKSKLKIGIIGAGVAGLAAAVILAKNGCDVTVYEKEKNLGGAVRYQIPNIRFDKAILDSLKEDLEKLRVDIIYEKIIGKDIKLADIRRQYDCVILATGAGVQHILKLDGEVNVIKNEINDINHLIMYSQEYLRMINENSTMKLEGNVAVIGGGNTALDCARYAASHNAEVSIYYRRTEEKMPCRIDELKSTKDAGVNFKFLVNPRKVSVTSDGKLEVTFIKTKIIKDENLVEKVVDVDNSTFTEIVDHLILATGYEANHKIYSDEIVNLQLDKNNNIVTNEKYMLENNVGLYAIGDLVTGSYTVINAIKMGMKVAQVILSEESI